MHWAQEVQHGPREGGQWWGLGSWTGVLHAGHLRGLFPSTDTIAQPTDEETETQQGSTPCPVMPGGPVTQHSSPRHEVGARR